ncbi:hypothetical protein HDU88_004056 [Geranomyces variabilis]|nr:hypothetical protein HDU88_004056 [Geranomyces variabilis]
MLRHRQQLRLLPPTTSSPSSRAVLAMAPANRRPASSSSSSPSSSSSSSSLPSGSSQHANRSFEQTVSAASPPPPSTSFLRRIWNTSFADPANNMLTAMSLLWRNTMYSTELWVAYRQEGHTVTRRADIKHMQRNKRDLLRVMPAAIFFAVPFAIPLLPVLMRVAPGFLPSVFVTREVLEMKVGVMRERREKGAEAVLEAVDKAIGRSVGGGSSSAAESRERQHAAALARRWTLLREQQLLQQRPGVAPGAVVRKAAAPSDSDLISLQTLFRDHATLLDVPPATLRTMMSFAGISTPLSPVLSHVFARLPRARLLAWIDWVLKDDGLLRQQGINSLSDYELMEALDERGFINLTNRSTAELRTALAQHLRFTKAATDAIIPRARAAAAADARNAGLSRAPLATTATSANTVLPHDEIAAVATLVLVARAMRLHEV